MTIHLDPASPVPIYLQIVDQVRRLIALGALRPGDRLPAVRDLAAMIRINRNTAARAIQELEREGVVRTQVGLGTFVAEEPPAANLASGERAVDSQCDRLIVEARAREVPLEQLPSRLWRRIDVFRQESAAHGPVPAGGRPRSETHGDTGREGRAVSASVTPAISGSGAGDERAKGKTGVEKDESGAVSLDAAPEDES